METNQANLLIYTKNNIKNLLLGTIILSFISIIFAMPARAVNDIKFSKSNAYVGVIPYYYVNNRSYILLGRETKDSRKVDAGVYVDFGAVTNGPGVNIFQIAANTLNKDTLGKLKISEQELLKSSKIIAFNDTEQGREVYYIFYKLSAAQFVKINKIKVPHVRLSASGVANACLQKDNFVWFDFNDLLLKIHSESEVQSCMVADRIDGKKVSVNFNKYFVMNCLLNPELYLIVKSL